MKKFLALALGALLIGGAQAQVGLTGSSQVFPPGRPLSITEYGAVGDGAVGNAAVNTNAINAILATGRCAYIPYTSAGYNFGTLQVTVGTGQCVIGENQAKLLSQSATSLFYVTAFQTIQGNARIDNLTIDMTGAPAGSTAIRNATSLASVSGVQISHILCLNSYECIGDEASASNYVVDEKWSDIRALRTKGRQFFIRRSRGFMWIDTLRIDNTDPGQILPVTWDGATFNDFAGLEVRRYDMVGPTILATTTAQTGSACFRADGVGGQSPSVWLDRILCDNTSGTGPELSNINYLFGDKIEGFQNLGGGIALSNINNFNLIAVLAYGAVGITGASASKDGFSCTNCTLGNIAGLNALFNTGQGITLNNGSEITITGFVSKNNTLTAALLAGTLSHLRLRGGSVGNNGAGVFNAVPGGIDNVIEAITGWNPQGGHTITVTASPFTYTTGISSESVCLYGGTVSSVTGPGGVQILSSSNACVPAGPNESYIVTYTAAPTMSAVSH